MAGRDRHRLRLLWAVRDRDLRKLFRQAAVAGLDGVPHCRPGLSRRQPAADLRWRALHRANERRFRRLAAAPALLSSLAVPALLPVAAGPVRAAALRDWMRGFPDHDVCLPASGDMGRDRGRLSALALCAVADLRAAGVLLGLLAYKPQLWLLVPVALVAARQWRALAWAIGAAGTMALASLAVFGIEPWRAWVGWFIYTPPEIYQTWLKWGRLHGESVYTNLVLVGASHGAATVGQTIATLLAGACVWWCYSRPLRDDLRLAVLLAATVLAAPHVTNYDTVLLVVAATLVFAHGLDHGFGRGGVIVPVLVWMIQLFDPPGAFRLGLITPVLTAA